ncbi:MAG: Shedu immune nuclease family protein [Candidatus Eisenbacteria bacterium]
MSAIKTKSTSHVTADADAILLRDLPTVRLLFYPMLVENRKKPEAAVKGTFVYQRKGSDGEWVDIKESTLTNIKKDEGVQLPLHSGEVHKLFVGLSDLYAVHSQYGVPRGERMFVSAGDSLRRLAGVSDDDITGVKELGAEALGRLVKWAVARPDLDDVLTALEQLEPEVLAGLSLATGLRALADAEQIWGDNLTNDDEDFWQETLLENAILLEQLFAFPVVLRKDKAYVGGKTLDNKNGRIADYLAKNGLTKNAVLIEIKTPCTDLLGSEYRSGIFRPSNDLSGAVMQVLDYRRTFTQRVDALARDLEEDIESCEPPCLVLIGNAEQQLDTLGKRRSFELFRRQFKGVEIVTFDELFEKTTRLLALIRSAAREAS